MNADAYREFLLNNIKPFAHSVSGGKEIQCRCFYCSDSKDPTHAHFYISVPQSEDELSFYHCKKSNCGASGIVTTQKLIEWGIYDADMAIDLVAHNKIAMKYAGNSKFRDTFVYRLNNTQITDDKLSRFKLKYINDRLGINLTFNDCIENKIVLNLGDLLKENHITEFTRHPNIVDQLDANFIGFISFDNAFINMRNLEIKEVYKTINKRYINYSLFNKFDNSSKYYILPTRLELADPNPIKLHVAEGPFDILSIKFNLRRETYNNIYACITGAGYKNLVQFVITKLCIVNLELHIYPDNDVTRDSMLSLAYDIAPFVTSMYIHRNTFAGEKDFGVPLDRINETIERII